MRKTLDFVVGWLLLLAGVTMLILPGPGLLGVLAGLVVLSNSYPAAHRFTDPVRRQAHRAAVESVGAWWRITLTALGGVALVVTGIFWMSTTWTWVPFAGAGVGTSLIVSGIIVWILLTYSWKVYRPRLNRDHLKQTVGATDRR